MKRFIILFISAFFALKSMGQNASFDRIFNQYQEAEGVTSIKISRAMFSMLNKLEVQDSSFAQIKPMLDRIRSIQILITDNTNFPDSVKPTAKMLALQQQNIRLSNQLTSALQGLKLEDLVMVNSRGSKVRLFTTRLNGETMVDLIMTVASRTKNIFMYLDGEVDMKQVNSFIQKAK